MSGILSEVAKKAGVALSFDPDALKAKYLYERDRRIREDGNDQYQEIKGEPPAEASSRPLMAAARTSFLRS